MKPEKLIVRYKDETSIGYKKQVDLHNPYLLYSPSVLKYQHE